MSPACPLLIIHLGKELLREVKIPPVPETSDGPGRISPDPTTVPGLHVEWVEVGREVRRWIPGDIMDVIHVEDSFFIRAVDWLLDELAGVKNGCVWATLAKLMIERTVSPPVNCKWTRIMKKTMNCFQNFILWVIKQKKWKHSVNLWKE